MTDLQRKEIDRLIKSRSDKELQWKRMDQLNIDIQTIFYKFKNNLTIPIINKINFFDKIPREQQDKLRILLDEEKQTRQKIAVCCDKIINLYNKSMQRAVDFEIHHMSLQKESEPLYFNIPELCSEFINLFCLGTGKTILLNDIADLLKSVDDKTAQAESERIRKEGNDSVAIQMFNELSAQMTAEHNQLSAQMTAEHNQQTKKSTEEIQGYKKSKERQKIPYPAAAKILLTAEGVEKPTQKQIQSTRHRMQGWDNYIYGKVVKNKHQPPKNYDGRGCTTAEFGIMCKDIIKEKGYRKNLSNPVNYDDNKQTDGDNIFDI